MGEYITAKGLRLLFELFKIVEVTGCVWLERVRKNPKGSLSSWKKFCRVAKLL